MYLNKPCKTITITFTMTFGDKRSRLEFTVVIDTTGRHIHHPNIDLNLVSCVF